MYKKKQTKTHLSCIAALKIYFIILVHVSLVRSQSRSHTGIPRTSTRKGSRQRGASSTTGFSFSANNGLNTRTITKQGNRPSWNMDKWNNDRSRQRIPKPPPQNSIKMQQWGSPFSYRSASDDMYLNPAKHPPVLVRDRNSSGRSVPKSRPLKSKVVKKVTTPLPAEVKPPVDKPVVPLQEPSANVASESKLELTTLAPPEPSSAAQSLWKTDSPSKEQQNSEPSLSSAVISRVQQSSSSVEFPPATEPSIQLKPTHTASAFAHEKLPESQNQQPKSTQIKSVPRPPRPILDSFHADKRMPSSKQMTYRVFSSWLDAPGMQDNNGKKAKGKHNRTVSTLRRENKGANSASEVTSKHNKKMLSKTLFDKSQVKKTPFALAAAEGLTGEMNRRPNAFPNKPDIRYSNIVNSGNVKTSSGNQIHYNNEITITTPMPLTEKQQRPHEVVSMESRTQANSGYQQLVRQSPDFRSIKRSESSRQKMTTSSRTNVNPRRNVGISSYPTTSNTKINQVDRAEERRHAGSKRIPTNIARKSKEMLMHVVPQTGSVVGNIQEPTDISAHSKGIPKFVAPKTSSLITSKERKGQIEPDKLFGTQSQNVSASGELRRVLSLNKISLQDSENVNHWNIKNDILQKNFQNPKRRDRKDFVFENYRAHAGDNSKTITEIFNTQPRTAEGPQRKNDLEPKHKVIVSPKRISNAGHVDTEFSGQDLLRKYNKQDKIIRQKNQSSVYFSPTGHLHSKTETVRLKQQDGNNAIVTEKQDTQSGTTRQGNEARLIEDVNQHSQSNSTWRYNPDGISSAQVHEGMQNFVWQENLENIKSAGNKGRKNSYVLRDKQESVVNQADESLSKGTAYINSGDFRDVLKAESQTLARSEAVSSKGYSAGPIEKPCDVAPVCGSDGFTYMSECFMWS